MIKKLIHKLILIESNDVTKKITTANANMRFFIMTIQTDTNKSMAIF